MSIEKSEVEIKSDGIPAEVELEEKAKSDSSLKETSLKIKQESFPYERVENEIDQLISEQLAKFESHSIQDERSPPAEKRNIRVYTNQMSQNRKFKKIKTKKCIKKKKLVYKKQKKESILQFPYIGPKRGALAVELILNMNVQRLSFINDGVSLRKTKSQILYKTHSFASPTIEDSDSEMAHRIATERRAAIKPRSEPIIKEGMVPIMYKYIEEVERRQEEDEEDDWENLDSSEYDSYRKVQEWMTASIESYCTEEKKIGFSTEKPGSSSTWKHKPKTNKFYEEFLCCCPSSCDCQKPRCHGFPFCPCHAQPWPTSSSSDLSENWKTVLNKFTKDCYLKPKCDESFQKKPIIPITYLVQYLEKCEKCPCGKKKCTHKEELRERYNAMVMKTYYSHMEPSANRDSTSVSDLSKVSKRKKSQDGVSLDKSSGLDSSSDSSFSRDVSGSVPNASTTVAKGESAASPDSSPKVETNLAKRDSVLTFRSGGSVRPCRTGSRLSIRSISNKPQSSLATKVHDSATTIPPKDTPVTQSVFSQGISTDTEVKKCVQKTPVEAESEPKESSESECSDIVKIQEMHRKELTEKCKNLLIEMKNQNANFGKIKRQKLQTLMQISSVRRFRLKLEGGLGRIASVLVCIRRVPFKESSMTTYFNLLNFSFGRFLHDFYYRRQKLRANDFHAMTSMIAVTTSLSKTPFGRRFVFTSANGRAFIMKLIKHLPCFTVYRLQKARDLIQMMLFNLCTEPMGFLSLQNQDGVLQEMRECLLSDDLRKKKISVRFFIMLMKKVYTRPILIKILHYVPYKEVKHQTYNIKQTDLQDLAEKLFEEINVAKKAVAVREKTLLNARRSGVPENKVAFEGCGAVRCSLFPESCRRRRYTFRPFYCREYSDDSYSYVSTTSSAESSFARYPSELINEICTEVMTNFSPSLYTDEESEDEYDVKVQESLMKKPKKKEYTLSYQNSVVSIFSSVSGDEDQESVFLEVDDEILENEEFKRGRKMGKDERAAHSEYPPSSSVNTP